MQPYLAMIRNPDPGRFSIEYPDLPGCTAVAGSFREAQELARPLLVDHLLKLRNEGDLAPLPRTLQQLKQEGLVEDGMPTLVPTY